MQICLFDIDGTLILSGGAGKSAMEAALQSEFGITKPVDGVPFSGRTDRAIARDLFRLHRIEYASENWQRFVAAYLRHLPACLSSHQGEVLPGIFSLLKVLGQNPNVAIGLLTGNLRDGARLKLCHFDLFQHFQFGGYGDHHFERDDVAREAVAAVHSHFKGLATSHKLWVIGDTPLDIACARAIGAHATAVATGWHTLDELASQGPDLLIKDFSDATTFLCHFN